MRQRGLVLAGWLGGVLLGCAPCDRSGCQAIESQRAVGEGAQGIGGVVAYQSDVSADGCVPCGFSEARIKVWALDAPSIDLARAQIETQPLIERTFEAEYLLLLDPGAYVMCVSRPPAQCRVVEVPKGGVVTAHLRRGFGNTRWLPVRAESDFTAAPEQID